MESNRALGMGHSSHPPHLLRSLKHPTLHQRTLLGITSIARCLFHHEKNEVSERSTRLWLMHSTSLGSMHSTSLGSMQSTSLGSMQSTSLGPMQPTSLGPMQSTRPHHTIPHHTTPPTNHPPRSTTQYRPFISQCAMLREESTTISDGLFERTLVGSGRGGDLLARRQLLDRRRSHQHPLDASCPMHRGLR